MYLSVTIQTKSAFSFKKSTIFLSLLTTALCYIIPAFICYFSNYFSFVAALKNVINPAEVAKEIVIVNTENGFVPDVVQVKKGEIYKIHIVNLNMKEKNISFLMDSFTQSHNTIYGNLRTFTIEPKVEGVFSYQCPETGVQGKLVVIPEKTAFRKTASQE